MSTNREAAADSVLQIAKRPRIDHIAQHAGGKSPKRTSFVLQNFSGAVPKLLTICEEYILAHASVLLYSRHERFIIRLVLQVAELVRESKELIGKGTVPSCV